MSHEFTIDCEAGLLKETFTGLMSLEILTESNKAIITHPGFREGLKFLTDFRNAQIPFGYKTMCAHIFCLPSLHVSKQAFVVAQKTEYGMIRMFLTLTEGDGIYEESKIFTSNQEGIKWLTS